MKELFNEVQMSQSYEYVLKSVQDKTLVYEYRLAKEYGLIGLINKHASVTIKRSSAVIKSRLMTL